MVTKSGNEMILETWMTQKQLEMNVISFVSAGCVNR